MERLYQVALSGVICLSAGAYGADFCSLIVKVTAPDGRRPVALVSVIEQSGRKLQEFQRTNDTKFCDLGILPVTVKVGTDQSCNQVVVNNVPLRWGEPYHLYVTYEPCGEEASLLPTAECDVLFRVTDIAGKWIEGATVQLEPSGIKADTDAFGRAFVGTKLGDIRSTITARGYSEQSFKTKCDPEKAAEPQEAWIKMSSSPGPKP
jgi:hypothetical protein